MFVCNRLELSKLTTDHENQETYTYGFWAFVLIGPFIPSYSRLDWSPEVKLWASL